jgi:hypothetical protein
VAAGGREGGGGDGYAGNVYGKENGRAGLRKTVSHRDRNPRQTKLYIANDYLGVVVLNTCVHMHIIECILLRMYR